MLFWFCLQLWSSVFDAVVFLHRTSPVNQTVGGTVAPLISLLLKFEFLWAELFSLFSHGDCDARANKFFFSLFQNKPEMWNTSSPGHVTENKHRIFTWKYEYDSKLNCTTVQKWLGNVTHTVTPIYNELLFRYQFVAKWISFCFRLLVRAWNMANISWH